MRGSSVNWSGTLERPRSKDAIRSSSAAIVVTAAITFLQVRSTRLYPSFLPSGNPVPSQGKAGPQAVAAEERQFTAAGYADECRLQTGQDPGRRD